MGANHSLHVENTVRMTKLVLQRSRCSSLVSQIESFALMSPFWIYINFPMPWNGSLCLCWLISFVFRLCKKSRRCNVASRRRTEICFWFPSQPEVNDKCEASNAKLQMRTFIKLQLFSRDKSPMETTNERSKPDSFFCRRHGNGRQHTRWFPFCLKCLSEVWVNLETMLPCQSAEDGLKGEKRKFEIINMNNEISKK